MFVRKKKNKSGSISVQIIDKSSGTYKVIKTIGCSDDKQSIAMMWQEAHELIPKLVGQTSIDFLPKQDQAIVDFLNSSQSLKIRVIGPEIVLGKLFDRIGFNQIKDELFRHLVLARLVYPGSKLKTIDYLLRYQGKEWQIDQIYRFLDRLSASYKTEVEQIAFNYTKGVLQAHPAIVFYDVTTLYFEASDEDDLRKTGFSKDGKHSNPQIVLGFLVGINGYPIGYEIFEGNTYEGHTLIPVLNDFEKRFDLNKPIVVADAGLLSKENIQALQSSGYQYILGARIKNETDAIREKILESSISDGQYIEIRKSNESRLIVSYSKSRAQKDAYNRERGLKRLEKSLRKGKLTKSHINNRGYNKYLKLTGNIRIEINYDKFNTDSKWDGLKGYVTNSNLPVLTIIENYSKLWHIEKAFRISKTDLRIRPIYHRLKDRIDAHICIAFVAYTLFKELERILYEKKAPFSPKRATELLQTIYALDLTLPYSKMPKTVNIGLSDEQKILLNIFDEI